MVLFGGGEGEERDFANGVSVGRLRGVLNFLSGCGRGRCATSFRSQSFIDFWLGRCDDSRDAAIQNLKRTVGNLAKGEEIWAHKSELGQDAGIWKPGP